MSRSGWPFPRSPWERRDAAEALFEQDPERLAGVLLAVVRVLAQGRIGSQRMLRAAVRGVLGRCSDGDVDAAVEVLGACVRRTTGGRGATKYTLDVARLPPELRDWIASKP